jgi:double-strand break repair protein MRE11
MEDIRLCDFEDAIKETSLDSFLKRKVESMICQISASCPEEVKDYSLHLPSVRLRVDAGGFQTINVQQFGQDFVGKVANPDSVLLFQKHQAKKLPSGIVPSRVNIDDLEEILQKPGAIGVRDLVNELIGVISGIMVLLML